MTMNNTNTGNIRLVDNNKTPKNKTPYATKRPIHELFDRNVVREIIKTDGIFGSSGLLGIQI